MDGRLLSGPASYNITAFETVRRVRVLPNCICRPAPYSHASMASLGRVLIVEDELQVALLVQDTLQEFGYEVAVATGAQETLELIRSYQPSVVLLDLSLPGLSGEAGLARLRREAPAVPVIIVSGNRDEAQARALLAQGAFDYVTKPFQLLTLERAVAAAVASGRPGT
jgi:DNA-binding response OmpR family regulator